LANRRGSSGDNYTNTVFDSTATKAISAGTAPFAGTYRPETSLAAAYNGYDAAGTWQLIVQDRARLDSGKLNSWSLTIQGTPGTGAGAARAVQSTSTVKTTSSDVSSYLISSRESTALALLQSLQQSLAITTTNTTEASLSASVYSEAAQARAALASSYQSLLFRAASQHTSSRIANQLLDTLITELGLIRSEV
jgi:hypothetical protein